MEKKKEEKNCLEKGPPCVTEAIGEPFFSLYFLFFRNDNLFHSLGRAFRYQIQSSQGI